jgi:hypothetical protein
MSIAWTIVMFLTDATYSKDVSAHKNLIVALMESLTRDFEEFQ